MIAKDYEHARRKLDKKSTDILGTVGTVVVTGSGITAGGMAAGPAAVAGGAATL